MTSDLKSCNIVLKGDDADIVRFFWINNHRLMAQTGDTQARNISSDGNWFAANSDGTEISEVIDNRGHVPSAAARSHILDWYYLPLFSLGTIDGSDDILVGHRTFGGPDGALRNIQPFRFNTKTGALSEYLDVRNPEEAKGWVFDQNDQARIMVASGKGARTIYYRDVGGPWTKLASYDEFDVKAMIPVAFGFDDTMYVSLRADGDTTALYRFNLTTKQLDPKPLLSLEGFDYNGSLESDRKAKKILGYHYVTDAAGTAWIDPKMKEAQQVVDKALPGLVNDITCRDCLTDKYMLVRSSTDRQPPVFFLYETAAKKLVMIGPARPQINAAQMGTRDFYRFKARDGMEIPVYVTLPAGRKGPQPTVVMVHGGTWVRGAQWEWEAEAQFLASRGYVVIQPEFRGSTGFGAKLFRASFKQWGLTMQDDVADATQWAIAKGYSDPHRIAIAGASYGGYATLMGLIKNPELYRCGFEWVGVTDIGMMSSIPWNDASLDWVDYGMKTVIGDPDADAKQLEDTSPLEHASELHQPLLMAYGGKDRRVPIAQGVAFHDAVSKTNHNVEFLSYTDEGHGWSREPDSIDFWSHVEKFLDKNLKNAD